MTSKEIIKRLIKHDRPPRIGLDFMENNPCDFSWGHTACLIRPEGDRLKQWNRDPSLVSRVPWFNGELMLSPMGNIYGRLEQKTKGECVKGALQDGWEALDTWVLPVIDEAAERDIPANAYRKSDRYVLGGLPFGIFSTLRDCRHMDNALMDTLLEPDYVKLFLDKLMTLGVQILDRAAAGGMDGIMIFDDLGTQINLFFSPDSFRELFKPYYKKLADEIHARDMDFFLHSCGKVYDIVGDMVEAGVDVFQFDQPELSGSEVWAREFGATTVFYCPVDIQKIMVSGDRRTIEEGALHMVNCFKSYGGSLIAKDYPSWGDINVRPEWAQWARDQIIANAAL
jgi:hypothetical protein